MPRRFSMAARERQGVAFHFPVYQCTSPIISLVFSETSILVLGAFAPPGDVGLYQVGRRLSELATVCGGVAIYVALPSIAKFHALRRADQVQRTVNIANSLTVVPGLCVLLVLIAEGGRIRAYLDRASLARTSPHSSYRAGVSPTSSLALYRSAIDDRPSQDRQLHQHRFCPRQYRCELLACATLRAGWGRDRDGCRDPGVEGEPLCRPSAQELDRNLCASCTAEAVPQRRVRPQRRIAVTRCLTPSPRIRGT